MLRLLPVAATAVAYAFSALLVTPAVSLAVTLSVWLSTIVISAVVVFSEFVEVIISPEIFEWTLSFWAAVVIWVAIVAIVIVI